jgi:hypothetical protein
MLVAIYTGVLLLTPGLHHDFACHQNSRTHCTSCLSSQSAPNVDILTVPGCVPQQFSTHIEAVRRVVVESQPRFSDSGRAPPA